MAQWLRCALLACLALTIAAEAEWQQDEDQDTLDAVDPAVVASVNRKIEQLSENIDEPLPGALGVGEAEAPTDVEQTLVAVFRRTVHSGLRSMYSLLRVHRKRRNRKGSGQMVALAPTTPRPRTTTLTTTSTTRPVTKSAKTPSTTTARPVVKDQTCSFGHEKKRYRFVEAHLVHKPGTPYFINAMNFTMSDPKNRYKFVLVTDMQKDGRNAAVKKVSGLDDGKSLNLIFMSTRGGNIHYNVTVWGRGHH